MSGFKKATKSGIWLRMGICSPSGGGKTWTGLTIAEALAEHYKSRIAVIDSERGSAKKYADKFDFDVIELTSFEVENYIKSIKLAEKEGYKVLLTDSITHAWAGTGGILDKHGEETKKSRSKNSYTAWREVTPLHNRFIDAMLEFNGHLITTMRTKTEYLIEENEQGKKVPVKVGMAPIQRDGMEYEFDIVGDMDLDHNFIPSKTRCRALDGKVFPKPGELDHTLIPTIIEWLGDDAKAPEKKEYITDVQLDELSNIKIQVCSNEQYKIDEAKWNEGMRKKYNATTESELTKAQAQEWIDAWDKYVVTTNIKILEEKHYPVQKAITSAHSKHLPNGYKDSTPEELKTYLEHLENKEK